MLLHFTFPMAVVRAEQFSCSSRSLIFAAGVRLGLYSTNETYPNGVSSHKRGDAAEKSSFVSIHCSLEPSVSIPALLFFFPLQNAIFLEQSKQTQACLGGSAISSYLVTEGAGERVLLMAEVTLSGLSPLFLPNLRLSSDVLCFGGEHL